jgi:putative selenium metabolism hydrolase
MLSGQEARRILDLAEGHRDACARRLSSLVRVRSLSCQERDVIAVAREQMAEAGFDECAVDPLGNLVGRIGSGPRVLAIDGHVDTVDVGERANWTFDPFGGEIRDGHVLGRGSVDQKGGVAAAITAGRILREIGVPSSLTLYVTATVMEEDCDGLCWKYLIEERGLRPDLVVCTEPTNLGVYRGHRGRMEIEVSFRGLSAHGSAPERGRNAIYPAARASLEVERINERLASDPFLGKGTVTISQFVSGSPSLCAVADSARIHLDRRMTWGETRESAVAQVEAFAQPLGGRVEVLRYEVPSYTGLVYGMEKTYPTWRLAEDHPAVVMAAAAHAALFGRPARVDKWTFSTNCVTINGIHGIPTIGFGPGNEVMAHAPDERVPVDDLVKASAFYAGMALAFAQNKEAP